MLDLEVETLSFPRYPTFSLVKSHLTGFCQPSPKPSSTKNISNSKTRSQLNHNYTNPPILYPIYSTTKMINAVLVFNNAGQPRLTKFYTQLVRTSPLPLETCLTPTRKRPSNNASFPKSSNLSHTDRPAPATSCLCHLCWHLLPLPNQQTPRPTTTSHLWSRIATTPLYTS